MSWIGRLFGRDRGASPDGPPEPALDRADPEDDGQDPPEVVELTIEDSIDLHPFQPREIRDVVAAYLDEAWDRGFGEVRIIHGRGIGQQRQAVRKILESDPRIASFADAGAERGGWGATIARFAPQGSVPSEPDPQDSSDS